MRTWTRVQDGRGKPCLLLQESPLWARLLYYIAPRRLCFVLERREKVVLIHLSDNKANEIDKEE